MKALVEVTEAIEVLERTPSLLDDWLVGLSPEWLDAREGEGTWSPLEVVAHLAHNEETDWMTRLEIVLLQGESQPFEPYEREGFRTRFPDWPICAGKKETRSGPRTSIFASRIENGSASGKIMSSTPAPCSTWLASTWQ